jgi:hypothetical protein
MPTIYDHELSSYQREISNIEDEINNVAVTKRNDPDFNLTHFGLGLSNRSNMIIVGLCSLLEVRLTEIANQFEQNSTFKLGKMTVEDYLKISGAVEFGRLKNWGDFKHLRTIRNGIVHGYGGIIPVKSIKSLESAIKKLDIENILVGGRRVRITAPALRLAHKIVSGLHSELP